MTRDIVYNFTAPKDADFTLRLEHVYTQVQGGAQYQYRLQIQKAPAPDFRLVCTPTHDIHIDSHAVYQGGRQRLDVLVWRMNGYDEPITVEARNLPPGVTAEPIIDRSRHEMGRASSSPPPPMRRSAKAKSRSSARAIARAKSSTRKARGGVIVWDTVNTPAHCRLTQSIVLAVREKTPFAVTAAAATQTIKPGEPINVTVTAERRADMPSAIQLNGAGIELPTGLTIPTTTINPGQTEAKLTIPTTDKMKEGVYSFIINAEAQVPTGDKKTRVIYPSNPLRITVEAKK